VLYANSVEFMAVEATDMHWILFIIS